jgi:CHASE3 domain sensor protein
MEHPGTLSRPTMSIQPHGSDYWLKMPTEKLHAALSTELEDGGNAKVIKAILDTRNSGQIAKAMLAVAESNRALTEELDKIAARNQATSERLGRITITVSILAAVAAIGALIAVLRK